MGVHSSSSPGNDGAQRGASGPNGSSSGAGAAGSFNISNIMSPGTNTNNNHKRKGDPESVSSGARDVHDHEHRDLSMRWYDRAPSKMARTSDDGGLDGSTDDQIHYLGGYHHGTPTLPLSFSGSAPVSGSDIPIKQEYHVSPSRINGEPHSGSGAAYPMAPPISYGGNPSAYSQPGINSSVPLAVLPQVYNTQVSDYAAYTSSAPYSQYAGNPYTTDPSSWNLRQHANLINSPYYYTPSMRSDPASSAASPTKT
ncbi:unnamed protein product [Lymnaea stagnalis]|uniref:Uncharacterized protein n=1 Tax=Lymnaea stagnalis TaxID=6523 RepID=A0AAV2IA28_LYMST